jgi:hypothetical protein
MGVAVVGAAYFVAFCPLSLLLWNKVLFDRDAVCCPGMFKLAREEKRLF